MTNDELVELENQLSCPFGKNGKKLGQTMAESNQQMILETIGLLKSNNHQTILEIGHGNASHLSSMFKFLNPKKYYGLEISEVMHQEAIQNNIDLVKKKLVEFKRNSDHNLTFSNGFFDQIFTINTIYFFDDLTNVLIEFHRVLKIKGLLTITFVSAETMKPLAFVKQKFKLYEKDDLVEFVKKIGFKFHQISEKIEEAKSKDGKIVSRKYYIIQFVKI